jgi:hypothetical protein
MKGTSNVPKFVEEGVDSKQRVEASLVGEIELDLLEQPDEILLDLGGLDACKRAETNKRTKVSGKVAVCVCVCVCVTSHHLVFVSRSPIEDRRRGAPARFIDFAWSTHPDV